jgi:hypothetical protein
MQHIFYPGYVPREYIAIGDTCVINNNIFVYRGDISTIQECYDRQMPLGVYRLLDTDEFVLFHDRNVTGDIVEAYHDYMIDQMETDTEVTPRKKVQRNIFKVEIKHTDNYLKVLIKKILTEMQIDFHDYENRFKNENAMNNMKRLIQGNTNITWEKFAELSDILGFTWELSIHLPNGEKLNT